MMQIDGNRALALAAMMMMIGSAAGCDGGQIYPPPLMTSSATTGMDPSTASGTSGSGGAGGAGGAGGSTASGTGGSGGSGGSAPTCLDASTFADLLTVHDTALCAIARYDAAEPLGYSPPTWGSHGGPLTLRGAMDNTFALVRWTAPAGANGALTKQEVQVDAKVPMTAFLGGQAVDVPFFGWTALTWTGAFPDLAGEILLVKGSAVDKRYPTYGAYANAGLSATNGQGRVLLTGLSPVGDAKEGPNGLYAADSCGTAAQPSLLPNGDATCKAPIAVAAWGDASGPVTVDRDGNAFVVMSSFDGTQEARGFDAASIARGAEKASGVTLFKIPGYGSNLAALAPKAAAPGFVAYQPSNGTTYLPEDVIEQPYTVTGGTLAAVGAPKLLLKSAVANAFIYLMVDDQDRLWAGVDTATGATYVVLARTP